jgi:hypothetical protein
MATIVNTRDVLLQAAVPRFSTSPVEQASAAAAAAQQAAITAANQAALALTKYDNISNDGVLDRSEKAQVVLDWAAILGEFNSIQVQADNLVVTHTSFDSAYVALFNYLNGLSPAFNDTTQDTGIVRTTFNSMWTGYFSAKVALLNAIAAKAAAAPLAIIGGRNLHPDGGFERGTHPCTERSAAVLNAYPNDISSYAGTKCLFLETNGGDAYLYIGGPKTQVVEGRQYVLSFMYRTATVGSINSSSSYIRYSNGTNLILSLPLLNTSHTWTVFEMLWTCPTGVTNIEFRFGFNSTGYSWMRADCIQVEEGNKRTQWMPAPEDVAADTAIAATTATGLTLGSTGVLTGPGGAQGQMTSLPVIDLGDGPHFGARNRNDAPSEYPVGASRQFKDAYYLGVQGTSPFTYCNLETSKQYLDNSGGGAQQYVFINDKTYRRYTTQAANPSPGAWTSWVLDLDRNAYTGDLDATKDISLVAAGAGTVITGNSVSRSGQVGWDGGAFTYMGYAGGASVSFEPLSGGDWMAGLDSNPAQDSSYVNIDYAFYGTSNALYFYESGTPITNVNHGYATGDVLSIIYDGSTVIYMKNRTVLRTVAANITAPLGFDSSIISGTLKNIRLNPLSSNNFDSVGGPNKPANGATVGAPSGTNVGSTPATTVEANAAAGAAGANKLNNPPVLGNVSNIITNYSAGGPAKTVSTINMSSTGGTAPYKYSYTYTSLQSNDEVEITFTKSSSGGNTDNTCVVKALTFTSGLVDKGELTVTVRDASGLTASYTAVVQITSVP